MVIRPIETKDDITLNTVRETVDGKQLTRFYVGPDAASIARLGELPAWQYGRQSQNAERNRGAWAGTKDWPETLDQLRNGWPEGTAAAKKIALKIIPAISKAVAHKNRYMPTIAPYGGLALNYHAIATDAPEMFIGRYKTDTIKTGSKLYRIAINVTASAGVEKEVLQARAACAMALVMACQSLGKSVDVTSFYLTGEGWGGGSRYLMGQWHIAPAGVQISQDRLVFGMSAQALRRVAFAMVEHCPEDMAGSWAGGYGMPVKLTEKFPSIASQFDLVVDSECAYKDEHGMEKIGHWTDETSQVAWVADQLRQQGVNIR